MIWFLRHQKQKVFSKWLTPSLIHHYFPLFCAFFSPLFLPGLVSNMHSINSICCHLLKGRRQKAVYRLILLQKALQWLIDQSASRKSPKSEDDFLGVTIFGAILGGISLFGVCPLYYFIAFRRYVHLFCFHRLF